MSATLPFPLIDLAAHKVGAGQRGSEQDGTSLAFGALGSSAEMASEPPKLHTDEDLAEAIEEARQAMVLEIEAKLRAAMAEDIEKRRCDMLAAIEEQFRLHKSAFDLELSRLAGLARKLALALADAVIPRAMEKAPLVDITGPLEASLARLVAEPSIELRLPPDLVEIGTELMTELSQTADFKGEMTIVADPALGAGDAQLRWKRGLLKRSQQDLQAEAIELVDSWLQPPPEFDEATMPGDRPDDAPDTKSGNERVTP